MKKLFFLLSLIIPTLGWSLITPVTVNNLNLNFKDKDGSALIEYLNYFSHSRGGRLEEKNVQVQVFKNNGELTLTKNGEESHYGNLPQFISDINSLTSNRSSLTLTTKELNLGSERLYLKSGTDEYSVITLNGRCVVNSPLYENRELVQVIDMCTTNANITSPELIVPGGAYSSYLDFYNYSDTIEAAPERLTNVLIKISNHQFNIEATAKRGVIPLRIKLTGKAEVVSNENMLKVYLDTATVGGVNVKDQILNDLANQNIPTVRVDGSTIYVDLTQR